MEYLRHFILILRLLDDWFIFLLFQQIPIWWRWYYWGSPVAWSIYGTITCQIGDKTNQVVVPGSPNVTVKGYLKHGLGYDHDFLPVVGVVHFCWVLLFAFGFALGIRYLNFQTR